MHNIFTNRDGHRLIKYKHISDFTSNQCEISSKKQSVWNRHTHTHTPTPAQDFGLEFVCPTPIISALVSIFFLVALGA